MSGNLTSGLKVVIPESQSITTNQSLVGGILTCFLLNLVLVTFSSSLLKLEVSENHRKPMFIWNSLRGAKFIPLHTIFEVEEYMYKCL